MWIFGLEVVTGEKIVTHGYFGCSIYYIASVVSIQKSVPTMHPVPTTRSVTSIRMLPAGLLFGLGALLLAACAQPDTPPSMEPESASDAQTAVTVADNMSFFITSRNPGAGADLGGLDGADALCQSLAEDVGAGDGTWRAYLSTTTIHARDRIGSGPWVNAAGVQVAANLDQLHGDNFLTKATQLTERGDTLNGRGDAPNMHDILTGSRLDGTSFGDDETDHTCGDWTSSAEDGSAQVGHHDRTGGGANPESWNSAHPSRGCSLENLRATGGDGRFYCFAN